MKHKWSNVISPLAIFAGSLFPNAPVVFLADGVDGKRRSMETWRRAGGNH